MATIADIARHAGVSASTVSYVLSGKRPISPETKERVQASIRAFGYYPNAGARALASRRTNALALALPLRSDMHVPVLMQFVLSVATSARRHDHDLLLLTQDEGPDGIQRVASAAMVDAILVMDIEAEDARLPVLRRLDRPSALIGVPDDATGMTCFDLDFAAAGALCVEHLASLGHTEIALIGQPHQVYERGTSFARRTLDGFTRAAEAQGIGHSWTPCDPTHAGVREALDRVEGDVTGLVVQNEDALAPLFDAFRAAGTRVPADLSVIAMCPDDLAQQLPVPVTSVPLPVEQISELAVEAVMRQLDGTVDPGVQLVAPQLHSRASTGPRSA